jgi:hypothetical protein
MSSGDLVTPRVDLRPPLDLVWLDAGVANALVFAIENHDGPEAGKASREGDGAGVQARARPIEQLDQVAGAYGVIGGDDVDEVGRDEKLLRDGVANGLEEGSGVVLLGEHVLELIVEFEEVVRQLVREREVLPTRLSWRVQDDSICEERHSVTAALASAILAQMGHRSNLEAEVADE